MLRPGRLGAALTDKELERVRASVARGRPFGDDAWAEKTIRRLHLEHTVRAGGRPRKREAGRESGGGKY